MKETKALVTVVIPTFNRASDLQRALRCLANQTIGQLIVIVVDNSSTDGTAELIQEMIPRWEGRLQYIKKDPNGPASARNAGMRAAGTPYVLFHDSDVELPGDWVERAFAHMAGNPDMAAVGGYITYAFDAERVNAYGGDLGPLGLAWDVDEDTPLDPAKGSAWRIWINCSAMLARTVAVMDTGGFDERFFYGYEDSDLGWRLNLAGYGVAVFPDLRARHHVEPDPGAAHPEIVFHYCKNRLRSILKNASPWHLPFMLSAYAAYTLADLVLRPPRRSKLRALAWNAAHLGETLGLRRAIQSKRKTPDSVVFRLGSRRWLPPKPLGGQRRRPATAAGPGRKQGAHAVVDDRV